MRTLLTTTALVALFSMGAVAQEAGTAGSVNLLDQGYQLVDTDGLASRLMGFPVYSSTADDAEHLGEVNDLVIGADGDVAAVILGVGGFLGMGEKNVAVNYGDLEWTIAADNTERLVLNTTREALEAAADVELIEYDPTQTAAAPAADQPMGDAVDGQATDMAAAPATDQPADPGVDTDLETGAVSPADPAMDGVNPFDPTVATAIDQTALTADDLIGTNVYGTNNEHIGNIGDFVLSEGGDVDAVIIDFGGFLGIGVKQVAIAFEDLNFYTDEFNNRSLVINVTREQMEQAADFNRDTYTTERDTQRLVVSAI